MIELNNFKTHNIYVYEASLNFIKNNFFAAASILLLVDVITLCFIFFDNVLTNSKLELFNKLISLKYS